MSMTASASCETPLTSPLRRYELMTAGSSETLMRVIGLVRRRGGEVVSLDFRSGDVALRATTSSTGAEHPGARQSRLELAVAIDCRQGTTLALRLDGLIDVVAVREY